MSSLSLEDTPYLLDPDAESAVATEVSKLQERVELLRRQGTLTEQTIRDYYGERRIEQVAESNAIEGSTLTVGETEAAVLKGVTITGHDPAFIRDAKALNEALVRLVEMARTVSDPTDISQLLELHSLILGKRPEGGKFRSEPIRIRGSDHVPPKTWHDVMRLMEKWEEWSRQNNTLAAPVRATVLHAWLAHIHPFADGNGRTARAITNLELVRAGYPPVILRKKERERYITALAESDTGGDIRSFMELMLERIDGALTGLELSAQKQQGYSPAQEKVRRRQEQQLRIWDASVDLLAQSVRRHLQDEVEAIGGSADIRLFDSPLDLEEYILVCRGQSAPRTWAFITNIVIPGLPRQERLAYIGHRSAQMYRYLDNEGGPAIFWSEKNPEGYPKWRSADGNAPYALELTTRNGVGDEWYARTGPDTVKQHNTTALAEKMAQSLIEMAAEGR